MFIESAYWDPITIAATGRGAENQIPTRATGSNAAVDPAFTLDGLELATRMVDGPVWGGVVRGGR